MTSAPAELENDQQEHRGALATSAWVSSTYFAEGLPYSLVHQVATQYFTAMRASLESIGLLSLYGLAWNLKFLWSPLVDLFGAARRWLVVLEALLAIVIGIVAWPAQDGALHVVAKALVLFAVMAATHDIAIDGFYLKVLPSRSQAAYAGLRVAAYRVALLAGNGVLVWIAGKVSWKACFLTGAALLGALSLAHHMFLPAIGHQVLPARDPTASRDGTAQQQPATAPPRFVEAFVSFFRQPDTWLAVPFILLFRLGDAMMFSMSTPLLRDLGLDTAKRGLVSGVAGTVVGIAGAMLAAPVMARRGLHRTLAPIALVQAGALPIYLLLAATRPALPIIVISVLAEQLAAGIGTAGFSVFLMRRCAGQYKAAHFAIGTALMSVAATASGSISGYLARAVGYAAFFSIACVAALPGVVLSFAIAQRLARDRSPARA